MALAREICPVGKWRLAVRGLSASNLRSTMRLNAMAQVRAQTMAARISRNFSQPGQPRLSRAATIIAASANGSAKTVCGKRTKLPHFRSEDRGWKIESGKDNSVYFQAKIIGFDNHVGNHAADGLPCRVELLMLRRRDVTAIQCIIQP